jgi:hypothetical protein
MSKYRNESYCVSFVCIIGSLRTTDWDYEVVQEPMEFVYLPTNPVIILPLHFLQDARPLPGFSDPNKDTLVVLGDRNCVLTNRPEIYFPQEIPDYDDVGNRTGQFIHRQLSLKNEKEQFHEELEVKGAVAVQSSSLPLDLSMNSNKEAINRNNRLMVKNERRNLSKSVRNAMRRSISGIRRTNRLRSPVITKKCPTHLENQELGGSSNKFNCIECNITFRRFENFDVHKRHYCATRRSCSSVEK